MSLPGLDLSAPVEKLMLPTIYELKEGSEWRFEVAFGSRIEVKVRPSWHKGQKTIWLHYIAPANDIRIASLWQR